MQPIVRQVHECRVCGADDWAEVTSFGSLPLANGFLEPAETYPPEATYPVDVVVCQRCWLMSLRHAIDPEVLFRSYVYVSPRSSMMDDHMRQIFELCAQRAGLVKDDLVVEFGSNIGLQLEVFKQAGMRVVGVDPAKNIAEQATARGIETLPEFFAPAAASQITYDHGFAKLVLGRQCFAHIEDVHNVLDGVDAVLAPDGVLVIEVPYLLDLLDGNQFDTIIHEHASYFSVRTLENLFAQHNLRLIDVRRVEVHGGSIVVCAARTESDPTPQPAVASQLALEHQRGLDNLAIYSEFAARASALITELGSLVRELVAQDHIVAGYGAPSKGSVLLHLCGLGPNEVRYCIDTIPEKQGKVLAGSHIPVIAPERVKENQPDYFLLLAWNYADEIIAKERAFLEGGGSFVVPMPRPRVVSMATLEQN